MNNHKIPLSDQEKKYQSYIEEHIENVKLIWDKIKNNQERKLDDAHCHVIDKQIAIHDHSKKSFEEFKPYQANFFPNDNDKIFPELIKQQFEVAWNHHQKYNLHHWEYWVLVDDTGYKVLDMPFNYIIEMLCDWSAMSLKFNDKPSSFYNKNRSKMILSEDTREWIELYIHIFNGVVKNLLSTKED